MEIHFSTYASNAVDGNRDPDTSHGSCMGTDGNMILNVKSMAEIW